ncbi:hypothetical protein ATE47_06310 [Chryseobacterium sp. IHB B 17019]|jgi:hypothetical protein|uniref:DUF6261 family protein n=1 Tax=Chryseobacterium sp. IHB B 17019 TaxID=1721091 RepID=UPI000721B85E|nr:DUF6261 family protein [Chryseobacterium sp. IHB B 17019]ALR30157.1 hypothetical protein ATE47_06310 [Chryseobacterium sp. IHB B 17019]
MKKLIPVDLSRLHPAEFEQLIVRFIEDFSNSTLNTSTDADFKRLYDNIQSHIMMYHFTLNQVQAIEESVKITEADAVRDRDLQALRNAVKPYRNAKTQAEKDAFFTIRLLLNQYKNVQNASYKEHTDMLNTLVEKLLSSEYSFHVSVLSIVKFANHLSDSNAAFNSVLTGCSYQTSQKMTFDLKALRNILTHDYKQMANYIVTLANVKDDVFYKDVLTILNSGRASFSGIISAKRYGNKKESITI